MSRKSISRVTLLLGLAASTAGPAGPAYASNEPVGTQVAATAVQAAPILATAQEEAPDQAAPKAVQVSVKRTRGKYNQSIFQVSGGAREAGEVLRLASSPAFRSLGPHYLPDDRSGRYRYEVTVLYRTGKYKKVVTYSNTPGAPRVLVELIHKVENMPAPSFPPGFPFN
ncbi:hypothetical protein Ait01nite_064310 [Actinoplanes italicus]|uniref:Uncharacterized protein n=2 Tax=Actinoplanes italicus TaxID=113567 RepID=A0A2T0K4I6_9ACTN|nr:hypothetical protein CLV67_1143 [Actinoplanes italicus]GIE33386.1 hypothetical protein Ait01nite_064310 [Actinoplanes italicus]